MITSQKKLCSSISFILLIASSYLVNAQDERIDIGRFSQNDLNGWEERSFLDHTHYSLIQTNKTTVLKAYTSAAASGMFKPRFRS